MKNLVASGQVIQWNIILDKKDGSDVKLLENSSYYFLIYRTIPKCHKLSFVCLYIFLSSMSRLVENILFHSIS